LVHKISGNKITALTIIIQFLSIKDYASKPRIIAPINTCAYKVHFEALDGAQPKIAETIEDRDPMQGMMFTQQQSLMREVPQQAM
jgi:hypothetical protein